MNDTIFIYKAPATPRQSVAPAFPRPPPPYSSLDLWREFPEEAYSVALHPSGLSVLVGFSEKLRLMNLLIDDIRPCKEFMIRGCREVSTAAYR